MTLLVCLNECSYRKVEDITGDSLSSAFEQLVTVLRHVRRHRTDTALVAESQFNSLIIGDGTAFARWQADSRNREIARFLKLQLTRAPFSSVLDADVVKSTEYTWNGEKASGLGTAHLVGGLATSLRLTSGWDHPRVDVLCQTLADDDGQVTVHGTVETVRHASMVEHVAEHRSWLSEEATSKVHTGQALWDIREDAFPHLRFLPRVRDDLVTLQPVWVRSVIKLLAAYEKAATDWDRSHGPAPTWPTKVTPEHEQRKALCRFDDPYAGAPMLFDSHARFTPWVGRMHFRWDAGAGKVVIAYIGEKLR